MPHQAIANPGSCRVASRNEAIAPSKLYPFIRASPWSNQRRAASDSVATGRRWSPSRSRIIGGASIESGGRFESADVATGATESARLAISGQAIGMAGTCSVMRDVLVGAAGSIKRTDAASRSVRAEDPDSRANPGIDSSESTPNIESRNRETPGVGMFRRSVGSSSPAVSVPDAIHSASAGRRP